MTFPHRWLIEIRLPARHLRPGSRGIELSAHDVERSLSTDSVRIDTGYPPVPLLPPRDQAPSSYGTVCVRAEIDSLAALLEMRQRRPALVAGVFADPVIRPFTAPYCADPMVGCKCNVESNLGVNRLHTEGITGEKVDLAIVDEGLHAKLGSSEGWCLDPRDKPGQGTLDHGTMVAACAMIAAPRANLLDVNLFPRLHGPRPPLAQTLLSDAIAAYDYLLQRRAGHPDCPLVVVNAWGMYDPVHDGDVNPNESLNYSHNPAHPFTRQVGRALNAGIDVLFAAGNCGKECPGEECAPNSSEPGQGILGANGHPDVITVAAVTTDSRRLGYSSQGPAALAAAKPDLAGYSHFTHDGYKVGGNATGTSAAVGVVGGVVAALRQHSDLRDLPPVALRAWLLRRAQPLSTTGFEFATGFGVVALESP